MSMNGVKVVYACEYCGKMFKEVELCRQCAKRCKEAKESGKTTVSWRRVAAKIRYDYDDHNHYIEIDRYEWVKGFIKDGNYTHVLGLSDYTPDTVDQPFISDLDDDDGLTGFMYQILGHTKFEDDEALKEVFAEAFKDKLKEIANEL